MKKRLIIISSATVVCLILSSILFVSFGKAAKVKSLINLGNKYLLESKYEEAILAFENVLKLDKKSISARLGLGNAYLQSENFETAENVFNEAIKLSKNSLTTYLQIARFYEEKDMRDSAYVVLKQGYENTNSSELKEKLDDTKMKFPVTTLEQTVFQNSSYSLPDKVKIKIDNTEKETFVYWDRTLIDTSKVASYTINGAARNYDRKVELTIRIEPSITEIKDLNQEIKQGAQYTLPGNVNALLSDDSSKSAAVAWTPNAVNVNTPGVYEFEGTVDNYSKKVKLTLTIRPLMQQISMDKTLKKKLDTFFSNFSEAYVKPFKDGNISNDALIDFGISHIIINDWILGDSKLIIEREANASHGYIRSSDVDNSCYKYFHKKPKTHRSIDQYPYEGGCYRFEYFTMEAMRFSEIDKLFDLGDNYYKAEISIYESNAENDRQFIEKMTAKIKKLTEGGNERYILISYEQ